MKMIKSLLAASCASLLAFIAVASAEGAQNGFVTAVRVEGQVEYNLGDGLWHPLVPGKILAQGATVRSLGESSADLVLGREIQFNPALPHPNQLGQSSSAELGNSNKRQPVQQNVVRVLADTTLSVDKLIISDSGADTVSDTELNLTQGKIFCKVKKLSEASQYLVKIPKGVAGVRGTTFTIDVNGSVACFETTSHGVTLSFTNAHGQKVTFNVGAGFQLIPTSGNVLNISRFELAAAMNELKTLVTLYHAPQSGPVSGSEKPIETFIESDPYGGTIKITTPNPPING